jgi:hypothetical protein
MFQGSGTLSSDPNSGARQRHVMGCHFEVGSLKTDANMLEILIVSQKPTFNTCVSSTSNT